MPVLLTGATGFIGSHLAARLASEGARLHLLVRPGGSLPRPETGRPPLPPRALILEADLRDETAVQKAVAAARPRVAFHLAACTDVRREPDLQPLCDSVNLEGTLLLARALAQSGVERLVHFGTCEEYGEGRAPFREEDPPAPVSPYSRSKAAATKALLELAREGSFPVVILRPFLTYGPGHSRGRFLAQAVEAALRGRALPMTEGGQTREFNHVSDVVRGALAAAAAPGVEGEIINLASGDERRLLDVALLVYRLAGSLQGPRAGALPYREGEAMRFFGSTEKCRRLLGYHPAIPLENGLKALIEWERARRREKGSDHG